MNLSLFALLLISAHQVAVPHRAIDRCAQDGVEFYAISDHSSQPVQVERDGVAIRIEHPDPKS